MNSIASSITFDCHEVALQSARVTRCCLLCVLINRCKSCEALNSKLEVDPKCIFKVVFLSWLLHQTAYSIAKVTVILFSKRLLVMCVFARPLRNESVAQNEACVGVVMTGDGYPYEKSQFDP